MNYTRQQLIDRFDQLPDDVQEAFLSIDTFEVIQAIVSKHKLHLDQASKLSEQVGYLLLGLTLPEKFLDAVAKEVGIPLEMAGEIVKEINDKIFFPIRESLEQINGQKKDDPYQSEEATRIEHFSPSGNVSEQNIVKAQTPLSNPDNNAIIINKSVEEKRQDPDRKIFDEKMSKLFRLPKEEVELGGTGTARQTPKTIDPYRESVD